MKLSRKTPQKKKRSKWIILLIVISFLVIIRLILPFIVLHYANKSLAGMNGYMGHIEDIDLSLYRGAYIINDFYIDKVDSTSQQRTPFISSRIIDLSVEWKSLIHGRLTGELEFMNPVICFTKDKAEPAEIQKDTSNFRDLLKGFMPLKINRFEMNDGKIQYIDSTSKPVVNISMDGVHVLAQNLSSVEDTSLLPATVIATAKLYGGELDFKMKLNPLAIVPAFDMNLELKNTNLPELNEFFKAYANIDVNEGTFGLYVELAGKDKRFIGYMKPIIEDLDVVGSEDRHDSFFNKILEGIAGTAGVVLKNQKEDQLAAKIPITGEYGNTSVKIWYSVFDLLRNAFIRAIYPSIDYQINLGTVNQLKNEDKKGFLKKVFGKTDNPPKADKKVK